MEIDLAGLPSLNAKLERAVRYGRSIRLTSRDLDLMAACGAYHLLAEKAADELKEAAIRRLRGDETSSD